MPQTRKKVFRIVPKCPKTSQNIPRCPKMSTSDASLSEWTCFLSARYALKTSCNRLSSTRSFIHSFIHSFKLDFLAQRNCYLEYLIGVKFQFCYILCVMRSHSVEILHPTPRIIRGSVALNHLLKHFSVSIYLICVQETQINHL